MPAARWNRAPDDWETGRGPGEDDMEAEEEYRGASYGKTLGKTLANPGENRSGEEEEEEGSDDEDDDASHEVSAFDARRIRVPESRG